MENSDLWSLLFGRPLEDGKFLFANQAELASSVEVFTKKERSARSVASSLSAFFRRERTLPPELQTIISDLIAERTGKSHRCLSEFERLVNSENLQVTSRRKQARAEQAVPDLIQKVKDFFARVNNPKALVLVEYRDLPRSAPQAKYAGLAKCVVEAMLGGLSFAMVQPFCSDPLPKSSSASTASKKSSEFRHSERVEEYVCLLRDRIRKSHSYFLDEAIRLAPDKEAELRKRIVLYERNSKYPSNFLSGIQSRMLFTIYPKGNYPEAPITKQVFEWVAGKEEDYFIEREDNENFINMVGEQFFPIIAHWNEKGNLELPHTQEQLGLAIRKWNKDKEFAAEIPEDAWSIYRTTGA